MSRRPLLAAAALAVACSAAGLFSCVAYNEDCTPLVDNPDQIVGYLAGDVDITKARVRSGNNAIGELAADAYRHSADDPSRSGGTPKADVGIENSGSIRNEGVCQNNDVLPRGPVRRKTLRQVLPFDDTISLVTIDVATLKKVLEHAVAGFSPTTIAGTPPGSYLQISGVTVEVDCDQPAQTASSDGSRVTRIVLQDTLPADGGAEGEVLYDGSAPPSTTRKVRLACNSFVLTGGDGYTMLDNLDPTASQRFDEQGLNFQIAADYFLKTYPDAKHALPTQGPALTRWVFNHCAGTVTTP